MKTPQVAAPWSKHGADDNMKSISIERPKCKECGGWAVLDGYCGEHYQFEEVEISENLVDKLVDILQPPN